MSTTSRQVVVGHTVVLEIDIRDARGEKIDPASLPEVEIIDSQDNIIRSRSSSDVIRMDVGRFRFNYTTSALAHTGVWTDHWFATVNGFPTDARLNFVVLSASANIDVAGDQIGDPARVSYSEQEIIGINILLAQLKARLKNNTQIESIDAYGHTTYIDCPIFTDEELVWFLRSSLSEFNQTPHFTDFTFADQVIYERYAYVIIEGAFILASAAQMLIEAGREFTISDNGITMSPPPLSDKLNNELSQFVAVHREMLKYIKNSIKPHPIGFGSFRVMAISPNFLRLRHLRERRIT